MNDFDPNIGKDTQFKTGDKQAETARNGGKASGKAKRAQKKLADAVRLVAGLDVTDGQRVQKMVEMGVPDDELTNKTAMAVGIIKRAIKGDVSAFNAIRDLLGEKPKDELQLTGFGKLEIGFVESDYDPVESEDDIK